MKKIIIVICLILFIIFIICDNPIKIKINKELNRFVVIHESLEDFDLGTSSTRVYILLDKKTNIRYLIIRNGHRMGITELKKEE